MKIKRKGHEICTLSENMIVAAEAVEASRNSPGAALLKTKKFAKKV
jgi:hypothetical protein